MDKLIAIAKECGAEFCVDTHRHKTTEYFEITPDQLRATVKQVCAPLLKDIANLSAIVRIQNGNKHEDINCLLGIADKHASDYRTIMGDKK